MRFLLHQHSSDANDERARRNQFDAYVEYLASVRERLPANAYFFAAAPWHYDFSDHRCPHDSWLESLSVIEISSGDRNQDRSVLIKVSLLGAYHDGTIEISYQRVDSYSLDKQGANITPPLNVGHGDWLIDEVRLSDRGFILHEIEFSSGSRWLIECEDIEYRWNPL
jgi:hypothetical protein